MAEEEGSGQGSASTVIANELIEFANNKQEAGVDAAVIHGLFSPDRRKPAMPLNSALALHSPRFNDLRRSASVQTTPQCSQT